MALRTIQAPGIQVNEIDRSQYDNAPDISLPNSPHCFIAGFADKGDDYTIYSVPTREALEEKYGYPQNEAERYFYNGCLEILDKGSKLLTAKLPYDNNSKDKYCYVDYKIDPKIYEILTDKQILGKWKTINDVRDVLNQLLQTDEIQEILGKDCAQLCKIDTLPNMREVVMRIIESNKFKNIYEQYKTEELKNKKDNVENTFVEIVQNIKSYDWDELLPDDGKTTVVIEQWNDLLTALGYDISKNKYTVTEITNIVNAINNGKYQPINGSDIDLSKLKFKYQLILMPGESKGYPGYPHFEEYFDKLEKHQAIDADVRNKMESLRNDCKFDSDNKQDFIRSIIKAGYTENSLTTINFRTIENNKILDIVNSISSLVDKDIAFVNEYNALKSSSDIYAQLDEKIENEYNLICKFDKCFNNKDQSIIHKYESFLNTIENVSSDVCIIFNKYHEGEQLIANEAELIITACDNILNDEKVTDDDKQFISDKKTTIIDNLENEEFNINNEFLKILHIYNIGDIYDSNLETNKIDIVIAFNIIDHILKQLDDTNKLKNALINFIESHSSEYSTFYDDIYLAALIPNATAISIFKSIISDMKISGDIYEIDDFNERLKLYDKKNYLVYLLNEITLDNINNITQFKLHQVKALIPNKDHIFPLPKLKREFDNELKKEKYVDFIKNLIESTKDIDSSMVNYVTNAFIEILLPIFNNDKDIYHDENEQFLNILDSLHIDHHKTLDTYTRTDIINVVNSIKNMESTQKLRIYFYKKLTPIIIQTGFPFFEGDLEIVNDFISIEKVNQLRDVIKSIVNQLNDDHPYVDLKLNDSEITSYCNIVPDIDPTTGQAKSGLITTDQLDDYLTNNYTEIHNKIRIVDITRQQYDPTPFNTIKTIVYDDSLSGYPIYTNDCLGIVPVVVTPTNALYFQNMIQEAHSKDYNGIAEFNTAMTKNKDVFNEINKNTILSNLYIDFKNGESDSPTKETLSKMVADCFPQIEYENNSHYDKEHFKKIGIVVLRAFIDNANNNKLNFKVLESFVGSLDKYARSTSDNSSIFIDNVVNNNSRYIRCFSAANTQTVRQSSIIALKNQTATSLGFYKADCIKNISTQNSILSPLTRILDHMQDTRGYQIDMIVDAGLTNIGQYLEGVNKTYSSLLDLNDRPGKWWAIANKIDNFCKFTRKDCVYLLDSPRPFCLEGEQKIVRRTKPTNNILNNIIPKLRHLTGINSSYTIGYCNWFKCIDAFTKDTYWCPPSIKAAGIYCYTDVYFHKWDAPAGMNRGRVSGAIDTAFSPTNEEAGRLYTQCWNYAVNYPVDGIVIEGQRTFQRKATALDRVNVRRLMIHLEKETVNIAKYYLYEGHTPYLRDRFVNALTPIFEKAVSGYGISDYIIKCDETNNPTIAVERNELHCSIAVKPIKAVEFIVLNFIVTNQSANVNEEVLKS